MAVVRFTGGAALAGGSHGAAWRPALPAEEWGGAISLMIGLPDFNHFDIWIRVQCHDS